MIAVFAVALLVLLIIRIIKSRQKRAVKVLLILFQLLLILVFTGLLYFSNYYHAADGAKALLPETELRLDGGLRAWLFDGPGEDAALVFYPGAKVEAASYAPLMAQIAAGGVDCFLVEMPLHFAFLGFNAADKLIAAYDYDAWILAGHSLGGVAASLYTAAHPDDIAGIVMLASYPAKKPGEMPYLSIYGDKDGVLDRGDYEKSRDLWPAGAEELVIPGGNHAQFGDYGPQRGDGAAELTPAEQWEKTTAAILAWTKAHVTEGANAA